MLTLNMDWVLGGVMEFLSLFLSATVDGGFYRKMSLWRIHDEKWRGKEGYLCIAFGRPVTRKSQEGNEKRAKHNKKRNRLRERICNTGSSQGPSVQNM